MGLDFVSGQYGCLFSRCRNYVISSLIHGHFHIGLVIILWPILALDSISGQCGGLGMISRPIWKCPCINLYLFDRELLLTKRVPSFVKLKVLQSTPWLSSQLRNICVTEDHNILHKYVEITIYTFRHSWLIKRFVTWASNTTQLFTGNSNKDTNKKESIVNLSTKY